MAGFFDEFFPNDQEEISIAASQPVAYDFRSRFPHNINILGAKGHVIQQASDRSSGAFLHEGMFAFLGMSRTSMY